MAMNWVGGSRARSKAQNSSSAIKIQKQYFAKVRNASILNSTPGLAHAQLPTNIAKAASFSSIKIPNITLKHSPFAALYQLEKEQLEQERQERVKSGEASAQGGSDVESASRGRKGVDIIHAQDEEEVLSRKVAKRKRRELLESIGDEDAKYGSMPHESRMEKRSRLNFGGDGRTSRVVSSGSRADETFAERKMRLLGRSDWLGFSMLPKLRNRQGKVRRKSPGLENQIGWRLDKEDVYDLDEDTRNGPDAPISMTSPIREPAVTSRFRDDLPSSTTGNRSLLIEVGNKRLYTDRRGNNEIESIYSDGEEADVMFNQQNDIDEELQLRAQRKSPFLPPSEQTDRPFSSRSFRSASDDDLVATMGEMLASGTVSEGGTQERTDSQNYSENELNDSQEEDHTKEEGVEEEGVASSYHGSCRHEQHNTQPPSNSTNSQHYPVLLQLGQSVQVATESQDSVFVELITPDTSQAPNPEPTPPPNPMPLSTAIPMPRLKGHSTTEPNQSLIVHNSPFIEIPAFLLSEYFESKPMDKLALLEAREKPSFASRTEHRTGSGEPSATDLRAPSSHQDESDNGIRGSNFWNPLDQSRVEVFETENPPCSMIAEASVMESIDDEEVEGEDEWLKFMFS